MFDMTKLINIWFFLFKKHQTSYQFVSIKALDNLLHFNANDYATNYFDESDSPVSTKPRDDDLRMIDREGLYDFPNSTKYNLISVHLPIDDQFYHSRVTVVTKYDPLDFQTT